MRPQKRIDESPTASDAAARFTFRSMAIPEEHLARLRHDLYHSTGPGYVIFPGFLDDRAVRHVQAIWPTIDPARTHKVFWSKQDMSAACSDFYTADDRGNRNFYNFTFNTPVDEVTWSASIFVHMLRNRLSGRSPFAELFPVSGRALSYRVVNTRNSTTWVKPHRDYMKNPGSLDRNEYDLSRLQATLFLSEKGRDYSGTGFSLERNDGRIVIFGTDVPVKAGDLVIWRYNNLHAIENVSAAEGQLGFLRIIYPPEIMHPPRPYVDRSNSLPEGTGLSRRAKVLGVRLARGALVRAGLLEPVKRILGWKSRA
jgi:hypothetical protein